ncbi:MAG TPA: hypothetical protein VMF87_11155 [Streptosporangiaceae bacterium]|nr:hypothetical protein [Streptosporangiaceae bacterium]
MSALGVSGDPGGWQHAGLTLRAAAAQLTEELVAADASGGSGLLPAWQGPVADSYLAAWRSRHGSYADLISQVERAAGALIDFGEQLADLQARAVRLESQWLSTGLHLTADGTQFTLPPGHVGLAAEILTTLRGLAVEAAGDVEAMWRDIAEASGDLITVLEAVIDAVEDFQTIGYAAVSDALGWAFHAIVNDWEHPWGPGGDLLKKEIDAIGIRAEHNDDVAKALAAEWSQDADPDIRSAARLLVSDAEDGVQAAGRFDVVKSVGGGALTAVTVGFTIAETFKTAHKVGYVDSIEDHSGDLTQLATSLAVAAGTDALMAGALAGAVAAAPVLVPVGLVVVGGLLAAGAGDFVHHEVVTHRAGSTRVLTDIGGGIEDAAVWTATRPGV